jgi:hypothetical protein
MDERVKKKRVSRKILYFRFRDTRFGFIEAQFSAAEMVLAPMTVYRRGHACDAPLIAKLGGNGVGPRRDQSAKTMCLNLKHRAREASHAIKTSRFKSS